MTSFGWRKTKLSFRSRSSHVTKDRGTAARRRRHEQREFGCEMCVPAGTSDKSTHGPVAVYRAER